MPNKAWDVITYPWPNFNCCIIEVCEWFSSYSLAYYGLVETSPTPRNPYAPAIKVIYIVLVIMALANIIVWET